MGAPIMDLEDARNRAVAELAEEVAAKNHAEL